MVEDWVQQCQNGQTRAFAQVVKALRPQLLEFLYRMTRNRELAEDLGQEAFLKAYRLLGRYDSKKAAFSTWLFTIARNLCIDTLRRKRPETVDLDVVAGTQPSNEADPHVAADREEIGRKVSDAVQELEPTYREVFVLREYQNQTLEQIASIIGCPVGTVKSRLHRSRQILQKQLAPLVCA